MVNRRTVFEPPKRRTQRQVGILAGDAPPNALNEPQRRARGDPLGPFFETIPIRPERTHENATTIDKLRRPGTFGTSIANSLRQRLTRRNRVFFVFHIFHSGMTEARIKRVQCHSDGSVPWSRYFPCLPLVIVRQPEVQAWRIRSISKSQHEIARFFSIPSKSLSQRQGQAFMIRRTRLNQSLIHDDRTTG